MSQAGVILRLLRERGRDGVDTHELIYEYGITQVAARIWALRDQGYVIDTIDHGHTEDGRRRLCSYVLRHDPFAKDEPATPKPAPADPPVAVDLTLPCGCVRAADGRSWVSRCDRHGGGNTRNEPAVPVHW